MNPYQGKPKDRQTTAASLSFKSLTQTVPHNPDLYTSSRPLYFFSPPTSRAAVSEYTQYIKYN